MRCVQELADKLKADEAWLASEENVDGRNVVTPRKKEAPKGPQWIRGQGYVEDEPEDDEIDPAVLEMRELVKKRHAQAAAAVDKSRQELEWHKKLVAKKKREVVRLQPQLFLGC